MNTTGKIHFIGATEQVSASFQKREFVLEIAENPMYPQHVKFEFAQDKCAQLDNLRLGQTVSVDFNLRGRVWKDPKTSKDVYFNTLQAWRIKADANAAPTSVEPENNEEDLPF